VISFDEILDRIERAVDRERQWRRLETEVEHRKALYEELKVEKDRAEAAAVAKSNFLRNMSHEIRTPMTAMLGLADLLLETGDLSKAPEDRLEALQAMKRNGAHLLTIINDILDLSKIEAGHLGVERIQFNPIQIVEDVLPVLRVHANEKGLSLSAESEHEIPETMEGDPARLKQILLNLLDNAIKFTSSGSVSLRVSLASDRDDPVICFAVADTGIGIAQEQRSRLFRAFEQADNSTSRKYGGTGLGLAICKYLAGFMGGTIEVESELGRGSTFTLELPTGPLEGVRMLRPTSLQATDRQPGPPEETSELRPLAYRILVAEDSPDNQRIIRHLLQKQGAQVEMAENGQIAVEKALQARDAGLPFEVILMDMQMPILDGYDATRTLRGHAVRGPIIALSAHAMEGESGRCLEAGCDAYETKPIDRVRLIETIHRCVASAKEE